MSPCSWCYRDTHPLVNHHYPIPQGEGGIETVKICIACHALCHSQIAILDCTQASNPAEYQELYAYRLDQALEQDFPKLCAQGTFYVPYHQVITVNPMWKWKSPPRKDPSNDG